MHDDHLAAHREQLDARRRGAAGQYERRGGLALDQRLVERRVHLVVDRVYAGPLLQEELDDWLVAFLCGLVIAWVYIATHAGLSYSRAFVNSLVVIPMIVTVVMMVLNNNLVTAFGLMAVFAVVRFRNILRDTLDTSYVLAVLAVGMAAGTQRFSLAVTADLAA